MGARGQTGITPVLIRNVASQMDSTTEYREEQAREIAKLLAETGATYGLAVLGSAGADEGVYGRESGQTWIGVASRTQVRSTLCSFGGQDEYTIVRIGNQVLRLLWDFLKTTPLTFLDRANELKRLPRTGWLLAGVQAPNPSPSTPVPPLCLQCCSPRSSIATRSLKDSTRRSIWAE